MCLPGARLVHEQNGEAASSMLLEYDSDNVSRR